MANVDELSTAIGKIYTNLHALEFSLRLFLFESVDSQNGTPNLDQLAVDDWVPENPITNFDSLGPLVRKVNVQLREHRVSDCVDQSLVDLRNDLAHGRIISRHPNGPFRLLKFSRAEQGKVQVTTAIDLEPKWLTEQIRRTSAEVQKVRRICRSLGFGCFPD